jgi:hypothetical protein
VQARDRGFGSAARDPCSRALDAYVCYEQEPGGRTAANLLTRDKARLIAMIAKLRVLVRK